MAMALTRLRASTTDAYRGPDIGIGRCGMSGRSQMEFLTDVRHTTCVRCRGAFGNHDVQGESHMEES